ncbi:MAG TPA: hypothetical protein VGF79_02240 [Bacteroidia bacterium]
MKKTIYTFITSLIFTFNTSAQTPVVVAENTLKVAGLGEEVFYHGFSEGDQLIFNFEEVNGKDFKEIEIIEWPSTSKFMDYKTKKIENKTIVIPKTSVYKFRFYNSSISGRICRIKIQRIPASEATAKFNTTVNWKHVFDTSYHMSKEIYLVKSDTLITQVLDQVAKVHSSGNLNGNRTSFNFSFPKNTVAWSYYIGVNQAGQDAFESASKSLNAQSGAMIAKIPGYGPLAALALGSVSFLSALQTGEDVDYYLVTGSENSNLFEANQAFYYKKKGKVINDFARMEKPTNENYYFCFFNDNLAQGITVTVKVVAIVVNNEWGTRQVQKMNVTDSMVPYLSN